MQCHSCGTEVRPGQKFCMECGASLRGVADDTGEVPAIRTDEPAGAGARDEITRAMGAARGADTADDAGDAGDADDPGVRREGATARETDAEESAAAPRHRDTPLPPPRDVPRTVGSSPDAQRAWAEPSRGAPPSGRRWQHDPHATVQMPVTGDRAARAVPPTRDTPTAGATESTGSGATTAELPSARPAAGRAPAAYADTAEYAPAQWHDDVTPRGIRRHHFRFRTLFVVAVLALGAAVAGAFNTLFEIPGAAGVDAGFVGAWKINDLGTNNALAAIISGGVMVAGALAWCFGFRWGAGLAGGAGAALAGWAALALGLAELQISVATASAAPVDVTRGIGYWLIAGAGGLGAIGLVVSLAGSGRDRQGGLDPWIAALAAAAILVAAGGPLIPLGTADVSGNYSSETLGIDVPTMYFVGRAVQLGLLALCGVVGFLLVRRYGLGLAVGGAVAAGWMVTTAATGQTESPIGLAHANPGATSDLTPHGVTLVGMALAGFFALVAIVMAILDRD